jgi:hypothetical protein
MVKRNLKNQQRQQFNNGWSIVQTLKSEHLMPKVFT